MIEKSLDIPAAIAECMELFPVNPVGVEVVEISVLMQVEE